MAWLQQALSGKDVLVQFQPYSGVRDGIFATETATRALQNWGNVAATGIVDDTTWFVWMTPGFDEQLTLEAACGLTARSGLASDNNKQSNDRAETEHQHDEPSDDPLFAGHQTAGLTARRACPFSASSRLSMGEGRIFR